MTSPSPSLDEMISRVEAATGPDRELDMLIHDTLREAKLLPGVAFWPNLTASLDAALALTNRVLPGWTWDCGAESYGDARAGAWARVYPKGLMSKGSGNHYALTPALALILATLKALRHDR